MAENTEKKILGTDAIVIAVMGLFFTILSVVIVLAIFAFNAIRADNARIEASIAASRVELRAEQKADVDRLEAGIEGLRVEWRADINMLSNRIDSLDAKIDSLDDNLDTRLDEIEREQARTQGAIEVLRSRQAPNP